jgi:hypothetical protein
MPCFLFSANHFTDCVLPEEAQGPRFAAGALVIIGLRYLYAHDSPIKSVFFFNIKKLLTLIIFLN